MSALEVNNATIRYEDRGQGQVLLLVHGGLGAGSEWDPIAKELAKSFRKLRAMLPNSELAVVPGAGHVGPFTPERALIFTTMIGDFAERQQQDQTR